jgi:hypothetical protein
LPGQISWHRLTNRCKPNYFVNRKLGIQRLRIVFYLQFIDAIRPVSLYFALCISEVMHSARHAYMEDGMVDYDSNAFWDSLIDEKDAAAFIGVSVRQMQNLRYRGGGPRFIKLSRRCIRYRRRDLQAWAQEFVRSSTSDQFLVAA